MPSFTARPIPHRLTVTRNGPAGTFLAVFASIQPPARKPAASGATVALRMARLLHRMGYLRRSRVVSVTRDDLVGQYVGHTAPKTKDVLNRAMGGVLFIDEAYYLYRAENERDYGQEAIEILLQYIARRRVHFDGVGADGEPALGARSMFTNA